MMDEFDELHQLDFEKTIENNPIDDYDDFDQIHDDPDWSDEVLAGTAFAFARDTEEERDIDLPKNIDRENWESVKALKDQANDSNLRPFEAYVREFSSGRRSIYSLIEEDF